MYKMLLILVSLGGVMRVRNTHCVELLLTPAELASALGHPEAIVREAEVTMKEAKVEAIRVHLEYILATKGIPKRVRRTAAATGAPDWANQH